MNETDFNKALGEKLRAMRKEKKVSRETIAKHLNVGKDYIGKMERGESPIVSYRLTKWVNFLGGQILIGGEITVPNTISLQQKTPEG